MGAIIKRRAAPPSDGPSPLPFDPDAPPEDDVALHLTDTGNAARFARDHYGDVLRHCEGLGWLIYDGTRWCPAGGEVVRLAKETALGIHHEVYLADDKDERRAISSWALASESESRIRAMGSLAEV